jgi:transforming growth factor-beta-induced protein
MKTLNPLMNLRSILLASLLSIITLGFAQTNVYDDIISASTDHTYLKAAIDEAGLQSALQDDAASLTVFAPDNTAFENLADALGTDIDGLLALENLSDILLYHVLGTTALSSDINNGDIVTPLNESNTIKLTVTSESSVYANQAMVNAADLTADNGVVHSLDAVLLASETVADVAIDNGFSYLTAAVVTAELLPALTDPFADFTVFAPSNDAFDNLADALGTDIDGLLALENLGDILLYHVLASSVNSADINNGDIVTPLNDANTIKLTVTTEKSAVFVNQAQVELPDVAAENGIVHALDAVILPNITVADVAIDNGFSYLTAAVVTAELLPALTDPFGTFTVFAPDNAAFDNLAEALETDIDGLLALENLQEILLYHVLGSTVNSGDLNNGDIATPLNDANTIKVTVTADGMVYANQAMVVAADVTSENGVVHAIDAVILPNETVADVAIDNGFSYLTTAVVTAELLPALTNPFADFTVFAPDNAAFDNLAEALGTDIDGLLALENLGDILLYHVLGSSAFSGDLSNGDIVTPLNDANTIKLTVTSDGMVYANQAMVTLADVASDNGVVHAIDAVILPAETVVDVAIDNGFSSLAAAVITAELLPALTDPLAEFTVFAPDNGAFDDLAEALETDLDGLLSLPYLADILLYHVVAGIYMSTDLENGTLPTLYGEDITVDLSSGVMINDANVTLADVMAENGVVHVIDMVLLPTNVGLDELQGISVDIFPNPASDYITIQAAEGDLDQVSLINMNGQILLEQRVQNQQTIIDLSEYQSGQYILLMSKDGKSKVETINIY